MKKGFLVSIEGGEAGGKTTQIKLLTDHLKEKGIDFIVSKEPGGTDAGEAIRNILLHSNFEMSARTEFLLFSASRAEHLDKVVIPALESGKLVVLDRYYDSSYAYQGFAGKLDVKSMQPITEFAIDGVVPDLTLLLDISYEEGMKRKQKDSSLQKLDRMELKGKEYHDKVRNGFLTLADNSKGRIQIVDASKSIEEVSKSMIDIFDRKYNAKIGGKEKE